MMGLLSAEAKKLENQARFILEKIDNQIKIENRRRKEMILTLRERGYDPDPIVEWKKQQAQQEDKQDSQDDEEDEKDEDKDGGSASYNYLLGMPMWSLTRERKEDLLAKRDQKREEVETLRRKTPENLWDEDLNAFTTKLDEVEQVERDDENSTGTKAVGLKMASGKGGRPKSGSKKMETETQPSPFGERVEPKVDWEAKKKSEKGTGPGRKPKKSFDEGKSESAAGGGDDGEGSAPKPVRKRASKGTGEKKRTPKKRRRSWSGSDTSDQSAKSFGSDGEERPKIPPERQTSRRAALARPKYKIDDSDEDDDDDDMGEAKANEGVLEDVEESRPSEPAASTEDGQENGRVRGTFDSDSDSNLEPLTKRLSQGGKDNSETAFDSLFGGSGSASGSKAPGSHKSVGSGSDSEPPRAAPKSAPAPKKAPPKRKPPAQSDSDASDVDEEEFKPKKAPAARKPAASKKKPAMSGSDASDLDDDDFKPKKAAPARKPTAPKSRKKKATDSDSDGARKKSKPAKKSKKVTSSDDDDKMSDKDIAGSVAPRMTTGRAKAPVKYNFGTDSSEDDF